MNKPFRFFLALRLLVYTVLIVYLAGDFSLNGPLSQSLKKASPNSPQSIKRARANVEIARVGDRSITRGQLELATIEALWLQGKNFDSLNSLDRQIARYKALSELIDSELLNQKIAADTSFPQVPKEEVDARLKRLLGRFTNKSEMETAMKSQGIPNESALRDRVAVLIRQEHFIDSQISPLAQVSEQDARDWFDAHQQELALPERIQARHFFIPTLDVPSAQAKATLEQALVSLTHESEDFHSLAEKISMDPATQHHGGELGWMTRERLPEDFAKQLFALPLHQPTIFQTQLGWHLAEVTAKEAARPQSFDDAKPEILAGLRAAKRNQAIQKYREQLQKDASIIVHHELMNQ
ncbi:peptidylprolyl isomerase [Luteolibacter pohnpeiensis]|uniref:Peptidylprolyl isomerase n=1 Tax=Luteolibacter pohnpeiensis TaxID=454153 RepID=A0A934S8Y2_9BACT|nr:peptidylprolyl isomerase [Luteolibacter pohnpeiensis]MBK1881862.1 peptidylprolyl isomerase [Luteolibacter pohnpeiensis]